MDVIDGGGTRHLVGGGLVAAALVLAGLPTLVESTSAASLGGITTSLFADAKALVPVLPNYVNTTFDTLANGPLDGQAAGNGQNWSTSGAGMDVKNGAVETVKDDTGTAYVEATGITQVEATVSVAKDGVVGIITDGDGVDDWVGLLVDEASGEVRLVRSIAGVQTVEASVADASASHRLVLVETLTGYSASVNGTPVGTALLGLTLRSDLVGMYGQTGKPKSGLDDFLAV